MTKEQIELGMKCCEEFLCTKCPYLIYDDPNKEYTLGCTRKLIVDITELYFEQMKEIKILQELYMKLAEKYAEKFIEINI